MRLVEEPRELDEVRHHRVPEREEYAPDGGDDDAPGHDDLVAGPDHADRRSSFLIVLSGEQDESDIGFENIDPSEIVSEGIRHGLALDQRGPVDDKPHGASP